MEHTENVKLAIIMRKEQTLAVPENRETRYRPSEEYALYVKMSHPERVAYLDELLKHSALVKDMKIAGKDELIAILKQ